MKRIAYGIASVIFLVLILASTAQAPLEISVTVQNPSINPLQTQTITATPNEPGFGIVFVVQPTDGLPWIDFLNSHLILKSWWTWSLPASIKTQISDAIGGKIVSYKLVSSNNAHSITLTFPTNFTGINGVPSTAAMGLYKVLFVYMSSGVSCVELDFACGSWLVIPQVPFGTVMALVSSLCAIPAFVLYRRKHLA